MIYSLPCYVIGYCIVCSFSNHWFWLLLCYSKRFFLFGCQHDLVNHRTISMFILDIWLLTYVEFEHHDRYYEVEAYFLLSKFSSVPTLFRIYSRYKNSHIKLGKWCLSVHLYLSMVEESWFNGNIMLTNSIYSQRSQISYNFSIAMATVVS